MLLKQIKRWLEWVLNKSTNKKIFKKDKKTWHYSRNHWCIFFKNNFGAWNCWKSCFSDLFFFFPLLPLFSASSAVWCVGVVLKVRVSFRVSPSFSLLSAGFFLTIKHSTPSALGALCVSWKKMGALNFSGSGSLSVKHNNSVKKIQSWAHIALLLHQSCSNMEPQPVLQVVGKKICVKSSAD